MSILTRLGCKDGENVQVRIFSAGKTESSADSLMQLKLKIHQHIVEEISPEEQAILSQAGHDSQQAEDIIDRVKGISCNGRPTSCPDQLSKALEEAIKA